MSHSRFAVHDHFDGSAHCVQCHGKCTLTGAELAYTQLLRFSLETIALLGGSPNMMLSGAISDAGVPYEVFWKRAQDSVADFLKLRGGTR